MNLGVAYQNFFRKLKDSRIPSSEKGFPKFKRKNSKNSFRTIQVGGNLKIDFEKNETTYRKVDLDNTVDWINTIDFTKNTLVTDYKFEKTDDVDIYLVNRAGKIYIMDYINPDDDKTARIFNISLPVGQYALFIKVNDVLYKTNKVYQF